LAVNALHKGQLKPQHKREMACIFSVGKLLPAVTEMEKGHLSEGLIFFDYFYVYWFLLLMFLKLGSRHFYLVLV